MRYPAALQTARNPKAIKLSNPHWPSEPPISIRIDAGSRPPMPAPNAAQAACRAGLSPSLRAARISRATYIPEAHSNPTASPMPQAIAVNCKAAATVPGWNPPANPLATTSQKSASNASTPNSAPAAPAIKKICKAIDDTGAAVFAFMAQAYGGLALFHIGISLNPYEKSKPSRAFSVTSGRAGWIQYWLVATSRTSSPKAMTVIICWIKVEACGPM